MPIQTDPAQIAVQPSGRYLREFKTDLPRPNLNLNPLAEGIGQAGEQLLTNQAKITGREAGLNAVVQKNANGQYEPPPPPESFGETARTAYLSAIEQNYTNSVYRDVERSLNEIANKPNTLPEERIQLMNQHIEATLNSVDPKYKGQLGIIFGREFNQRQASILNQARSDDSSYRSHALAGDTKNFVNSAIDAWSAGDFEAGSAHLAQGRQSFERSIRLKTSDENLIADQMRKFDEQANGFRWFNEVYQKVRDAARDKTANPDDISRLSKMLQEGAQPTGATAFGVTDTDIVKNMSREARIHMRQIVSSLEQDYSSQFAQSREEAKAQELHDYLIAGGDRKPDIYSDKDLANASRKALMANNLNPYSAEGIKALAFQFNGVLPHEMYKTYFAGIHENDAGTPEGAARIRERLDLYRTLNALPTRAGVQDRTEIIGQTERNYLRVLEDKLQARYGLQEADRAVKAIFKQAGSLDQGSITKMVHSAFSEASGKTGPISQRDVVEGAINTITSFPLFGSPSYGDLPKAARDQIESSIATSISQGIKYDQAAKDAGRDFVNNWTKSKDVIAGLVGGTTWIQKKDDIPVAYDALSGQGSKDYLKPYVDKILTERLNDTHKAMLGELKYGDNVKLEPTTLGGPNRSYYITYYKNDALGFSRLFDKNGQPLIIIPQGAKDAYEKYTAAENQYRTITSRTTVTRNVIQPEQGSVESGTFENLAPIPKPELKIDLNHIDPLPSTNVILGRIKAQPTMTEDKKKIADAIASKITEYNLDDQASYIFKSIGIESQMNPNAKNKNSSAFGLGQFTDATWAAYGRGDRNDAVAQIDAFMRLTIDNTKSFERAYNRKPNAGELYLMHQQGAAGAMALLNNPNDNAMSVIERVVKNRETAVKSIYHNIPTDTRNYAGSMTSKQFTDIWMNRFN